MVIAMASSLVAMAASTWLQEVLSKEITAVREAGGEIRRGQGVRRNSARMNYRWLLGST